MAGRIGFDLTDLHFLQLLQVLVLSSTQTEIISLSYDMQHILVFDLGSQCGENKKVTMFSIFGCIKNGGIISFSAHSV